MKNIHVLPTENESRIRYNSFNKVYELCEFPKYHTDIKSTHNIYITSDEEIKEGDWYLDTFNTQRIKANQFSDHKHYGSACQKIILTTDQDLIKDGVQAIDDEFLEWFVKNPSCEDVEVQKLYKNGYGNWYKNDSHFIASEIKYKTIIPKEEPTEEAKQRAANYMSLKGALEPKQETLEEASKDYIENTMKFSFNSLETKTQANRMLKCAEFGAKWQKERMYNEEDMMKAYYQGHKSGIGSEESLTFKDWFEQFEKK